MRFLKVFRKSFEAHVKMVECILFYLNMVAQIKSNLIGPFCDENVSRLLRISGFDVKVLKINFTEFCNFFFTIFNGAHLRLVVMNNR